MLVIVVIGGGMLPLERVIIVIVTIITIRSSPLLIPSLLVFFVDHSRFISLFVLVSVLVWLLAVVVNHCCYCS